MSSSHLTAVARGFGVLAGAAAAALFLIASRPAANFARLPARVTIVVPVTGVLEVVPSAPRSVLPLTTLSPDAGPQTGTFVIRNQTSATMRLGFRAAADSRDLDGLLRIRLSAGRRRLADATLQGLRQGSTQTVSLASGASTRVTVLAWIPKDVGDGYVGRQADVSLVPSPQTGA